MSKQTSAKELFQPIAKDKGFSRSTKWLLATVVAVLAIIAWFLLTTRAVVLELEPAEAKVEIHSSLQLALSNEILLLPGEYQYQATAPGYHSVQSSFTLGDETLSLKIELEKLPGKLRLSSHEEAKPNEIISADIKLSGEYDSYTGKSDQLMTDIAPGVYQLQLSHPLYHPLQQEIEIRGKDITEKLKLALKPAYGLVNVTSNTQDAKLFIDEQAQTQLQGIKLAAGEHEFRLQHPQHKTAFQWLEVKEGEQHSLVFEPLTEVDALLKLSSNPSQASVTIDGKYRGRTPIELELSPNQSHSLVLFKAGYQALSQTVSIPSHSQKALTLKLKAQLGNIHLSLRPRHAKVAVDGRAVTLENGLLRLPSREHRLTISAEGYASNSRKILPSASREQRLSISLKTLEQQRHAALKETITSPAGQKLKLFRPKQKFSLGASRREQGRRANEVQRKVELNRSFYLGLHEVTNGQYRQFVQQHSSSHIKGKSLNGHKQPVVNISWEQAALYCNWLSAQEKLPAFYRVEDGKVIGFNEKSLGYRLPTEAEWAWAGRLQSNGKMSKFSWGPRMTNLENQANYGSNLADRNAAPVAGAVLSNYDDGYAVSAPIGSFKANHHGLYDMGGNVAEWIHDFYQIKTGLNSQRETNPMGPSKGKHHVIRGPNWSSARMGELRMAFRDYGDSAKPTVGFRVARTALLDSNK